MNPTLLLISGGVIFALATPLDNDANSKIIEDVNSNDGSGNYHFSYKTSNGLYRMEDGELIKTGDSDKFVVRGSYSYIDPDGNEVVVYYIADENGYVIVKPAIAVPPGQAFSANVLASLLGPG